MPFGFYILCLFCTSLWAPFVYFLYAWGVYFFVIIYFFYIYLSKKKKKGELTLDYFGKVCIKRERSYKLVLQSDNARIFLLCHMCLVEAKIFSLMFLE